MLNFSLLEQKTRKNVFLVLKTKIMARFMTYLCIVLTFTMYSQEDATKKIKATIDTFFEGFHKGDTILMKSVMMDEMILQTTFTNKAGENVFGY